MNNFYLLGNTAHIENQIKNEQQPDERLPYIDWWNTSVADDDTFIRINEILNPTIIKEELHRIEEQVIKHSEIAV